MKNIVLYIVLCCLLCLSGCGNMVNSGATRINAPVDTRYIVQNPVEFIETVNNDRFGDAYFSGSYFQISGLANKQVEDKINEHLMGMYGRYQAGEFPPEASGLYDDTECAKQETKLTCFGNFNNILSVKAGYTWMYNEIFDGQATSYEHYYEMSETYNVDLNTGEEFTLKAVFADNVDFNGVYSFSESAPFFFWDTTLIIGENYVDFNEDLAIANRFYRPGESIYSDGKTGARTLITYVGEEEELEKSYEDEGIVIRLRGSYQKGFPERVRQLIISEEPNEALITEMKQVITEKAGREVSANYNKTVTTSRVQDFVNIRIYEYSDIYSESENAVYQQNSHQSLKCCHVESDGPARINDIFNDGADIEVILETAVFNKLETNQRLLEESGLSRNMDIAAQAAGAADKFVGFCVNPESIFAEYLGDPTLPSYVIELKYADLGYENLSLFNWD